ncbi:Hypothetical predicted protein [Paramuricea clavata]|uniref:Uncharacterized protein n=1 Tax=Paramuricea clavata TaxID=317549 RepID=A0A6S7GFD2_PARCT|nr:Hypothetical predicted protein [Paramuricea clavata]
MKICLIELLHVIRQLLKRKHQTNKDSLKRNKEIVSKTSLYDSCGRGNIKQTRIRSTQYSREIKKSHQRLL